MHWHPWNDAAFERARERGTAVLVVLHVGWCPFSRSLRRDVLGDPDLGPRLAEAFTLVSVDRDERPELDARLRRGGWPTVLLCDAEGEELVALPVGDTELLARALRAAAEADSPSGAARAARATFEHAVSPPADGLGMALVDDVVATLLAAGDPVHGGWGTRQKFPHPEALHLLIVRWSQTGDPRTLQTVLRTLRCMQAGEIYDGVEGGFYRYARQPDWSEPHHEKPLESNAKRLLAYVEAYQALGEEGFRETAEGILAWMHETLLAPDLGAFRASQDADAEYAHLRDREARARRGAPPCDPTIYTDRNAAAAIALLKAGVVLGDRRHLATGEGVLDFLLGHLWHEDEGAEHFWNGTGNQPGWLRDQGTLLRALVEAVHYAGANRFLAPARALARTTIETLGAADGSFRGNRYVDGTPAGPLQDETFVDNAVTAEALVRLGHLVREPRLVRRGRSALAAIAPHYRRFGLATAAYGRAVDLLLNPPVHVTVVGPRDADLTRSLREAALAPYVASRIVQSVDPAAEPHLLERVGLPASIGGAEARAYVHHAGRSYAETSRPERLPALMARAERSN